MLTRSIPSTGEQLPVVGLGTWQTFDVSTAAGKAPLRDVLRTLSAQGGKVIDSSPMYGKSEEVVGELTESLNLNHSLFFATKVWTMGRENGLRQMNESLSLLRRKQLDLMQVHNLTDWRTHLPTLHDWKEQGRIRYTGITHYTQTAYPEIEKILRQHPVDFLQINYSLMSREAEDRLLPLAREKKVAVIINRPFEEGALFRRFRGTTLPGWAKEIGCETWGNIFLKFILSHPAVTCVVPGTSNPSHMLDNASAGTGPLPDDAMRLKIIQLMGP